MSKVNSSVRKIYISKTQPTFFSGPKCNSKDSKAGKRTRNPAFVNAKILSLYNISNYIRM